MTAPAAISRFEPIPESEAGAVADLQGFLSDLSCPHVIRGLVADWPLVKHGMDSRAALGDYLRGFYSGAPLIMSYAPAAIDGRIGYNASATGFNFERAHRSLDDVLNAIEATVGEAPSDTVYVGSSLLQRWFPGLDGENPLVPTAALPLTSLWLGNRVVVSAHFDVPDNLACCVAGRRRFTLFPPEQLENLYVGPWDNTPAGQPISLVDLRAPDLERYPRFATAMAAAQEVILEPGDALYIPSMWWHNVEGLDDLNVLMNYWWRDTPAYMGSPLYALQHAFLSLKGLPPEQRAAWREIFDYHIFSDSEDAVAHIPEPGRGIHGPQSEERARVLRAQLLKMLNQ